MLELNVNILSQFLWTLTLNQGTVTRYRVTIDFTVDNFNCLPPSDWTARKLLELNDNERERIKSLYVENLGEIATVRANLEEHINRGQKVQTLRRLNNVVLNNSLRG